MKKRITIQDVAKKAGFSATMVSRVMNNYGYFSESAKNRVLRAAKELGYKPDIIAGSLKTRQTKAIGVVIADVINFVFTNLIRGVEDVANRSGYNVILCNSDEVPLKEREYLSALLDRSIDGLIVSACPGNDSYLKKVKRGGTPLVLIDRKVRGLKAPSVTIDNEGAAYEAVSYLTSLGHRRIGVITGSKGIFTSEGRLAGYKRALEACDISVEPNLIVSGENRAAGSKQATKRLLRMKNPPTALFTLSEPMTTGALLGLRESKVKIPEEMSIIGFDDPLWAPVANPALTAVAQPGYSMGLLSCQTLLELIERPDSDRITQEDVVLKTELMIRESCIEM